MHFGATLRLLRNDAGVSLRQLAEHVGVSSAYLSRVENGHDAPPTADRLLEIARVLRVSPELLFDLSGKVSPTVARYLERVPGANALFLEIARRNLSGAQVARLRALVDREFPLTATGAHDEPPIDRLLTPERIVLGLRCTSFADAVELASTRLALATNARASDLSREMLRREETASTLVGAGLALPHALREKSSAAAALVTFAKPLDAAAPDGAPLEVVLAFVASPRGGRSQRLLLSLAAVARPELVGPLRRSRTPTEALDLLRAHEARFGP